VKPELPVEELVAEVRRAAASRQAAAYRHLHVDGYRPEKAEAVLSRVPKGLDPTVERFVLEACAIFGFETVQRTGKSWYIEFGGDALVEHLPGVPGGSRYLGTFDREEALVREDLDFFASGHPLVEGIFEELEDGSRGRVALLHLPKPHAAGVSPGVGLLFVHRRPGEEEGVAAWKATALDLTGRPRPEWAAALVERRAALRGLKADDWFAGLQGQTALARDWPSLCRALARKVPPSGRLLAVAAFRVA
jgi:ATP-dependent helicase HepA